MKRELRNHYTRNAKGKKAIMHLVDGMGPHNVLRLMAEGLKDWRDEVPNPEDKAAIENWRRQIQSFYENFKI